MKTAVLLALSDTFNHFKHESRFLFFRRRYLLNLSSLFPFKESGFIVGSDVEVRSWRNSVAGSATMTIVPGGRTGRACGEPPAADRAEVCVCEGGGVGVCRCVCVVNMGSAECQSDDHVVTSVA